MGHSCQPSLRRRFAAAWAAHRAGRPAPPHSSACTLAVRANIPTCPPTGTPLNSRRSAHGRLQAQPALRRRRCCNGPGRGRERLAFGRLLSKARLQRRAPGTVASLGVRPHIFGWDVAQGVICPSARAHQQEEPRTLQVRQARPMVQHRLLFTQATLSPFAHVIAVSEWDSYRAVKPRSGRGRSLRQTSSPSSATLHGAGPPAVL